jgi:hypothetical protein
MVHLAAPAPAASHDARTHVGAAALSLVRSHPYLGLAVWGMARTEQPGLGTFAVDRRARLFYDPEVALGWSVAQVSAVLYHEACHVLRVHAEPRPTGVDHGVWNLAADLEINDDLAQEYGAVGVASPVPSRRSNGHWSSATPSSSDTAPRCGSTGCCQLARASRCWSFRHRRSGSSHRLAFCGRGVGAQACG